MHTNFHETSGKLGNSGIDMGSLQVGKENQRILNLFSQNGELSFTNAKKNNIYPSSILVGMNCVLHTQNVNIYYDKIDNTYKLQTIQGPVEDVVETILKRGLRVLKGVNFNELSINGQTSKNIDVFHSALLSLLVKPFTKAENLEKNESAKDARESKENFGIQAKPRTEDLELGCPTGDKIHIETPDIGTREKNKSKKNATETINRNGSTFDFYQAEETNMRRVSINGKTTEDVGELFYLTMLNCVKSEAYGYTLPEIFIKNPSAISKIKKFFSDNNLPFEIVDNIVHIK